MNVRMLGPVELVALLTLIGFAGYLLLRAVRVSDFDLAKWAAANQVSPDRAGNRIRSYLAWSRAGKAAGFVVGVTLAMSLRESLGPLEAAIFGLVGYLVGTLAVELVINKPPRSAGAASLTPRLVSRYVPGYALKTLRFGALTFWTFEGVYLVAALNNGIDGSPGVPEASLARFAATTFALAMVMGGVEGTLRLIVTRRQPSISDEQTRVDDAIRSASAHAAVGGGISLLCVAIAGEALGFGAADGVVGTLALVFGYAAIVAAPIAWLLLTRPPARAVESEREALPS